MLALLLTSLTFAATPLKVVNFGHVKVSFVIGDVTTQNLSVIAASHPSDRVISQGGIAGAITRAGAVSSLDAFQTIMARAGRLEFGSVHAVNVPYQSQLRAAILLNLINLDPLTPLRFDRVEQLDASDFPFQRGERALYRELLGNHEVALASDPPAAFIVHEMPFRKRREDLLKPYAARLGFAAVSHAVSNMIGAIVEMDREGVSVGPLGNGRSGPLTTLQSIEAVLAGAKSYVFTRGDTARPIEIRYVLPGEDNLKMREAALAWIETALEHGQFLATAGDFEVSGTNWLVAREDFRAREEEAVVTPAPPVALRVTGKCARALDAYRAVKAWVRSRRLD